MPHRELILTPRPISSPAFGDVSVALPNSAGGPVAAPSNNHPRRSRAGHDRANSPLTKKREDGAGCITLAASRERLAGRVVAYAGMGSFDYAAGFA